MNELTIGWEIWGQSHTTQEDGSHGVLTHFRTQYLQLICLILS